MNDPNAIFSTVNTDGLEMVQPYSFKDDGRGTLTNSRMSVMKACLRKHYFAYELGIRKDRKSSALHLGGAFHVGQEARAGGASSDDAISCALESYAQIPAWANPREWACEAQTVAALLRGYFQFWALDEWKVIAAEQIFDLSIINPETKAAARIFRLGGKLDKIVELPDGRLALVEYKTASNPNEDYWNKLKIDSQISLYMYAARRLGFNVQTVIYDVTSKPGLKPLRATPEENRKYKKDGTLYANLRDRDETPEEYGGRVAADVAAYPSLYFMRREIPRLESDLEEFEWELWQTQQLMRDCQRHGRWYRNSGACLHPFPCEFREICFNGLNPATDLPVGFVKVPFVHEELVEE